MFLQYVVKDGIFGFKVFKIRSLKPIVPYERTSKDGAHFERSKVCFNVSCGVMFMFRYFVEAENADLQTLLG